MADDIEVKMRLCFRPPGGGAIKCNDGGFKATYESGTVGPKAVTIDRS